MADVFDAVLDAGRKSKDFGFKTSAYALVIAADRLKDEIRLVRAHREAERRRDFRRVDINMMPKFGEMHMLEVEACRLLCPALRNGNSVEAADGWKWVAKQPWADDLKAAPVEKRFY